MSSDCKTDSDCGRLNYCDLKEKECIHDDIFDFKALDIFAYVLMGVLLGFANAGGLGAGPVKIFVYMVILNYSMKESTYYTYPVLFGSKIADNMMGILRKHPVFEEKPLVNFSIVMVFIPFALLGSVLGSTFSKSLPEILLQILLIACVTVALVMTTMKILVFLNLRKLEQQQQSQEKILQKEQNNNNDEIQVNNRKVDYQISEYVSGQNNNYVDTISTNSQLKTEQQFMKTEQQLQTEELQDKSPKKQFNILENFKEKSKNNFLDNKEQQKEDNDLYQKYQKLMESEKYIPLKKIGGIIFIMVFMLIFYAILGTSKLDSVVGISMCSTTYWILFVIQFPIYMVFFMLIKTLISKEEDIKKQAEHVYKTYDISLQKLGISKFIIYGLMYGIINGLVGFGGSLMVVPTMVIFGLHPRSATASTSFLTIFGSAITVIMALLGGLIDFDVFAFLFGISFLGSTIFTYLFNLLINKYRLQSFTIVFTFLVQAFMLLAITILFIINLIDKPFEDQYQVESFC